MPYINTKTNVKISSQKELAIKEKFGNAITIIPGKSESRLMLGFEDECKMYFKGESMPMAFVEVKLYGSAAPEYYNKLTGEITSVLSDELDIDAACVYVKYEEIQHWGCNGMNF